MCDRCGHTENMETKTSSYRSKIEPYASRWRAVVEHARGHGLIHGMQAHALLDPGPGKTWAPADTAMFLRDMVEDGALRPVKKDLAGAGHSVRAFRGLQQIDERVTDGPVDVDRWLHGIPCQASDAHLWTFVAL